MANKYEYTVAWGHHANPDHMKFSGMKAAKSFYARVRPRAGAGNAYTAYMSRVYRHEKNGKIFEQEEVWRSGAWNTDHEAPIEVRICTCGNEFYVDPVLKNGICDHCILVDVIDF